MELIYKNIKEENFVHKLNEKIVIDFISVDYDLKPDAKIFNMWVDYFKSLNESFVITEEVRKMKIRNVYRDRLWKTLWISEIAPPEVHKAKPRNPEVFNITKCI